MLRTTIQVETNTHLEDVVETKLNHENAIVVEYESGEKGVYMWDVNEDNLIRIYDTEIDVQPRDGGRFEEYLDYENSIICQMFLIPRTDIDIHVKSIIRVKSV